MNMQGFPTASMILYYLNMKSKIFSPMINILNRLLGIPQLQVLVYNVYTVNIFGIIQVRLYIAQSDARNDWIESGGQVFMSASNSPNDG